MRKFKKIVLTIVASFAFASGAYAGGPGLTDALVLYIPNRILDLLDLFSVNLSVGPSVRAELTATRACSVGAGYNLWSAKLYKDCNRQYGAGIQRGYYWSFISVGNEDMTREHSVGLVDDYYESFFGTPDVRQPIYEHYKGARDYWQIGGALGFLVEGEVYINPVEWFDLALGFLLIDVKQDDLTFDSF